jgi:hypothetical protein
MIGQILQNNNKRCYSNFSPIFREMNTPLIQIVLYFEGSWPARFGKSWEQATVVPWIWACDHVDAICFRSQCMIKKWDYLHCIPGDFWFTLLHFGHLQWWTHFSLSVTFYFEGMGCCCDDYTINYVQCLMQWLLFLLLYMTDEAMLMSYDDSSFVLHLSTMSITEAMIMSY